MKFLFLLFFAVTAMGAEVLKSADQIFAFRISPGVEYREGDEVLIRDHRNDKVIGQGIFHRNRRNIGLARLEEGAFYDGAWVSRMPGNASAEDTVKSTQAAVSKTTIEKIEENDISLKISGFSGNSDFQIQQYPELDAGYAGGSLEFVKDLKNDSNLFYSLGLEFALSRSSGPDGKQNLATINEFNSNQVSFNIFDYLGTAQANYRFRVTDRFFIQPFLGVGGGMTSGNFQESGPEDTRLTYSALTYKAFTGIDFLIGTDFLIYTKYEMGKSDVYQTTNEELLNDITINRQTLKAGIGFRF